MGDVSLADRTQLARQHGCYGYGLARKRHELHLIGCAVPVNVNHRTYVAGLQAFRRDVARQHYAVVFLNCLLNCFDCSDAPWIIASVVISIDLVKLYRSADERGC